MTWEPYRRPASTRPERPIHTVPQWRNVKVATINLEFDGAILEPTLIDRFEPHVVSFQQGNGVRLKVEGYKTIRAGLSHEGRGVGALVRNDVKVIKTKRFRMKEPWTGPKAGKRHDPRVYLGLLCEYRGARFWVLCVHWPFGVVPQAESEECARKFFRRHPNLPVFVVGDFNQEAHQLDRLAGDVDGRYDLVGKVDGVLSRDARLVVSHRRLAPEGRKWHGIGVTKWLVPVTATKENR